MSEFKCCCPDYDETYFEDIEESDPESAAVKFCKNNHADKFEYSKEYYITVEFEGKKLSFHIWVEMEPEFYSRRIYPKGGTK
jgi:hypothetical protein